MSEALMRSSWTLIFTYAFLVMVHFSMVSLVGHFGPAKYELGTGIQH